MNVKYIRHKQNKISVKSRIAEFLINGNIDLKIVLFCFLNLNESFESSIVQFQLLNC